MKPEGYRKIGVAVGFIEIIIFLWSLTVLEVWFTKSCPNHREVKEGGGRWGKGHMVNKSCYEYDARNISTLDWEQNRTNILIGKFLQIAVPHKEYLTPEEFAICYIVDFICSVLQVGIGFILATSFLHIRLAQGLNYKNEVWITRAYVACNTIIGMTYAIWRGVEGTWLAFGVGTVCRTALIAVMITVMVNLQSLHSPTLG